MPTYHEFSAEKNEKIDFWNFSKNSILGVFVYESTFLL